jgi:hypothetical protein
MPNARHLIPAPAGSNENPFVIKNTLTVFQAAMVYAGRHPLPRFLKPGSREERETFLHAGMHLHKRVQARLSWNIYCELLNRIKRRELTPVKTAYSKDGEIDPFQTRILTADLKGLAAERGEDPKYLRTFVKPVSEHIRPLTKSAAWNFARGYIDSNKVEGKHPSIIGLEHAAKDAKFRGGREFLRAAFREMQGHEVKPGRPRTKSAEK